MDTFDGISVGRRFFFDGIFVAQKFFGGFWAERWKSVYLLSWHVYELWEINVWMPELHNVIQGQNIASATFYVCNLSTKSLFLVFFYDFFWNMSDEKQKKTCFWHPWNFQHYYFYIQQLPINRLIKITFLKLIYFYSVYKWSRKYSSFTKLFERHLREIEKSVCRGISLWFVSYIFISISYVLACLWCKNTFVLKQTSVNFTIITLFYFFLFFSFIYEYMYIKNGSWREFASECSFQRWPVIPSR